MIALSTPDFPYLFMNWSYGAEFLDDEYADACDPFSCQKKMNFPSCAFEGRLLPT